MLISISEYAALHGRSQVSVRQMAQRGGFKTALKIGRNWCIDSEEEYPDARVRDGKSRGWRKKKKVV
ncbi:hypothetical protein FACS1894216_04870 [Synergistales bacterium]|nr:hypothetical protein FACS1894216_04870 [Synergistales bacterium]